MLNATTYLTSNEGIGGTIRNKYEDFFVEEIPLYEPTGDGPNLWIFIDKIGRTTLDVLLDISRELNISRKRMGFAGMKDKRAHTRQWICISNVYSDEEEKIVDLKDKIYKTQFLNITRNQKKLRIGQLVGNKFRILIKNLEDIERSCNTTKEVLKILETKGVPNYYGWQRFGKPRTNTHLVGRALVLNDLKEAVRLYVGDPQENEDEKVFEARKKYEEDDLEESLDLFPIKMRYERIILKKLIREKKKIEREGLGLYDESYKKAIFSLPKPLQRMFVHAYQSVLFNKVVSERIKLGINNFVDGDIVVDNEDHLIHDKTNEELDTLIKRLGANPTAPLYGSKVPLGDGKVGEIEKKVLKDEKLNKEDFLTKKTPKLGSFGIRRSIRFKVWDSMVTPTNDGLLVEFSIDKGSYATSVLREIMKKNVV
ncbi:MAG: tRNA pseudouridine(13) synthase TruD [Methanobrevibacter sp.]|nr:tRNA pseudouridine(13) synthase TruD [Candidatus Methanovirga aequatorialis]